MAKYTILRDYLKENVNNQVIDYKKNQLGVITMVSKGDIESIFSKELQWIKD